MVELAERFSFYGSQAVFVCISTPLYDNLMCLQFVQTNFIQQALPPGSKTGAGGANGQAGALDMGQQAANGLNTFYQFWCYITPLIGAYIADTHVRDAILFILWYETHIAFSVGPLQDDLCLCRYCYPRPYSYDHLFGPRYHRQEGSGRPLRVEPYYHGSESFLDIV